MKMKSKAWKTVGCFALLCVIVAGCVIMGKNTTVAAVTLPVGEQQPENSETVRPEAGTVPETDAAPEESISGSASVDKTYSVGLYFRSNGDGTCALAGMGSCTDVCVLIPPQSPAGDKVTEILPGAFADSIVGAVELPTTIVGATAASFAECPRLGYIRVAAGNAAFSEHDGALYTADGSVLLYCPVGRTAKSLTLYAGVKRIAAGALARCDGLESVCYAGSTAEWHGVIVGDENNALYGAKLYFNKS